MDSTNGRSRAEAPSPKLIVKLGSLAPWVRANAIRALTHLGLPAVLPILREAARIEHNLRVYVRVQCWAAGVILLTDLVWAFVKKTIVFDPTLFSLTEQLVLVLLHAPVGVSALHVAILEIRHLFFRTSASAVLAESLGGINDEAYVGPLAQQLMGLHWDGQPEMIAALIRLLPQLDQRSEEYLSNSERISLRGILRGVANSVKARMRYTDLVVETMQALARIGDIGSLAHMERLASMSLGTGEDARISRAAKASATLLRKRIQEQQAEGALLRASGPYPTAPHRLLRPAQDSAQSTAKSTLLRPSEDDAEHPQSE